MYEKMPRKIKNPKYEVVITYSHIEKRTRKYWNVNYIYIFSFFHE